MSHDDTPADLGESEPPHIKNWFSSYEYESFVLETNDNFGFSEHQGSQDFENECSTGNTLKSTENSRKLITNRKNEDVLIKCDQSEEENKCQKQDFESHDSSLLSPEPPSIENWFSSYVYESPEVDTIDDLILSDHKDSMSDCNQKTKESEKDEKLCVTPDDCICKQTFKGNSGSTSDNKNATDLPNNGVNVNSFENGIQNLEEPGDGFVSIKCKQENYEKSKRIKGVNKKRCVDSPNTMKKKKSDERVTLGDVTNILDEHSSVTGKWKCPRKSKPYIGPPLKQLRLGQWFRHV